MHIVIGVLTAIAGLLWALHSLQNAGVDLNAFNPFSWARRRRWEKKLGTKPLHSLADSMEAAAVLVVSIAKVEGEITRETKMDILNIFEEAFGIKKNRCVELFSSSTHLLKDVVNMAEEVPSVIAPSKRDFSDAHVKKILAMLQQVASLEHEPSTEQLAIIHAVEKEFKTESDQPTKW